MQVVACRALSRLVQRPVRPLWGYRSGRSTHSTGDASLPVLQCVGPERKSPAFNSERNDFSKLREIQLNVYRGRLGRDASYVKVIGQEVCEMLSRTSLDHYTLNTIGKVLRLFGFNQPYDQEFFDSVSDALLKTKDEATFNALLPSFLWVCARCQYYPKALLPYAGVYLLDNMLKFTSHDINMMVHTFAVFNHHIPGLIDGIERWFLKNETLTFENHLPWTLAWAGMVFAEYPKEMLSAILKDEYIEGCKNCKGDFLLIILLQLRVSLNLECADLKLGLGWDTERDTEQWGRCRSAMKGVGTNVIRMAYLDKMRSYNTMKRSVFGSNVHRAIRTALGGSTLVQSDAISLSGYIMDFEVLLDKWGKPIECPIRWKYRTLEILASSLGLESKSSVKHGRLRTVSDDLIQTMKASEQGTQSNDGGDDNAGGGDEVTTPTPRYEFKVPFNVASDWGRKFCNPPCQPARKLVIEGDGIYHFARNDRNHALGNTIVKKRHLEALGWEMITVDYKAWQHLSSGDAQADYIRSLINPQRTQHQSL